ncbi:MAG TPA: phage major capsid protein [Kofleriaceae bacterium]|nr:phage major capsid protein [Kofleriaceae bacterium]
MAAELLSNLSPALAQTFAAQLTRNWNRMARLAQNIPILSGGGQGGGQNVAWDVEFSGATAASFVEGSDPSAGDFNQDPITKAILPWGQYRAPFQLSNLEINAAAANISNAAELGNIVGERFVGAITKIISVINADLFTGTGTDGSGNPTIVGLNTALANTGLYAGINKATFTEWQGNVNANGGTARPLALALLAAAEQAEFVASGMEPDALVCSAGVHSKYEGLFESIRRTVDSGQGPIPSYQGSTGRLFWRGKPIIRDRNDPTGTLYGLNFAHLELRVLPWAGVPDGVRVTQMEGQSSNGQDSQAVMIPVNVYPLARTGSAIKFMAEIYCQLKVLRPNAHFMIQDISEV